MFETVNFPVLNEVVPEDAPHQAGGEVAQYSHSTLDKNMNLINTYQNKERSMLIRETPKGRIAFRVVGDFGWKSCEVIEVEE